MGEVIADNAKAWVALVMAALAVLNVHFGWEFAGISEELIMVIIGLVGTILVWLVPNRE